MTFRPAVPLAVLLVTAVTGCANSAGTSAGPGRPASPATTEFRDSLGHAVRFHLLAGATGPRHICS